MHVVIDFIQRLYHFDELIRWGGVISSWSRSFLQKQV